MAAPDTASLEARFAAGMGALLGPDFPDRIGLAVSGGGDSMAMLTLAHNWTRIWGVGLWVITVDHGLRPEAADEARLVAETCAELGWPHAVARWHWDGQGNLMQAARHARLGLIDRWRGGLDHVLMAHTADDVAEGFAMRLQRGAGVDGLAAMAPRRTVVARPVPGVISGACPGGEAGQGGFTLVRPCLSMHRDELRHYLRTLRGRWAEDPTNADPAYDRARARAAVAALGAQGLGAATLAAAAVRMRRARVALGARAAQVWGAIGREDRGAFGPTGDLLIDRDGLAQVERDTQARLLSAALRWVASADYAPRAAPLEDLLDRVLAGGAGTLHGVEARPEGAVLRLFREAGALPPPVPADALPGGLWDGRWLVAAPQGTAVGPLGEAGWAHLPRADRPAPHHAARSLPALWRGDTLVACDAAGFGPGGTVTLRPRGRARMPLAAMFDTH